MSAEDLFKHTLASWDDEVEYAETLRNRRNIFSTGLVVIAGLGAFQLSPFMGESDQYVIPCIWMRWTITGLVLLALILVVIGAKLLYSSGQESVQEQNIQKEAEKANPGTPRIRRAAELLRMLPDEEAALASTGTLGEAAWMLRAKKLQLSLIFLEAANRRVSNRIRAAGVFISLGYLMIVLAVAFYSVGINLN